VILQCTFEELRALREGARTFLGGDAPAPVAVAAPPAERVAVEKLLPRLTGDLSISTLADQRRVEDGVDAVVETLRIEMEALVLTTHAGDESAVAAYFDFAHSLSVLGRIQELGAEMEAMIELVTGTPATPDIAATFQFPD
jgi:hypothetical protein